MPGLRMYMTMVDAATSQSTATANGPLPLRSPPDSDVNSLISEKLPIEILIK